MTVMFWLQASAVEKAFAKSPMPLPQGQGRTAPIIRSEFSWSENQYVSCGKFYSTAGG